MLDKQIVNKVWIPLNTWAKFKEIPSWGPPRAIESVTSQALSVSVSIIVVFVVAVQLSIVIKSLLLD